MKRCLGVMTIALVVGLAVPAGAFATTVPYKGKIVADHPSGTVAFKVERRNGRPRQVKHMTFDSVKLHCEDDMNTYVGSGIAGSAKVSRRGHFELSDADRSFSGRIGSGGDAHGRISVHFEHPFHGPCDNKHHEWRGHPA